MKRAVQSHLFTSLKRSCLKYKNEKDTYPLYAYTKWSSGLGAAQADKGMHPCCREARTWAWQNHLGSSLPLGVGEAPSFRGTQEPVQLTHECWRTKPGIQAILSSIFNYRWSSD